MLDTFKCLQQTIQISSLFFIKIREAFKNDSNFQDVKVTQLRWGVYLSIVFITFDIFSRTIGA